MPERKEACAQPTPTDTQELLIRASESISTFDDQLEKTRAFARRVRKALAEGVLSSQPADPKKR